MVDGEQVYLILAYPKVIKQIPWIDNWSTSVCWNVTEKVNEHLNYGLKYHENT